MIVKSWIREVSFKFLRPAKTSRNTLIEKTSFFIFLQDENSIIGLGECSPIFGLSVEDEGELRQKLAETCQALSDGVQLDSLNLHGFPSIQFALDTASKDLNNGGKKIVFNTPFARSQASLNINGLIWMGDLAFQKDQVKEKVKEGYSCIKLKIGSLDFNQDLALLKHIRDTYGDGIELRLDANGAFDDSEALDKLNKLAEYNIHSIEQPIKQGLWENMAKLVQRTPIDIALDEELIGIRSSEIGDLLDVIKPHYIILKPSLLGGFQVCNNWVLEAERRNIKWWATSFLESNVGLNAIAQWVSTHNNTLYQGLGTGKIYSSNIPSPLTLTGESLSYAKDTKWDAKLIEHGQDLI